MEIVWSREKKILCLLRMTVEANTRWSLKWDFLRTTF